jgi:hypothetical protein
MVAALALTFLPALASPASARVETQIGARRWVSDVEDRLGVGKVMSMDGNTLLVGADGAAYVFERGEDGEWTETTKLQPAGAEDFGRSVGVSGTTAVVGASEAAYVFVRSAGGTWNQQARLVSPEPIGPFGDEPDFGAAVAIDGDGLVVGEPRRAREGFTGLSDDGQAYLFTREGTTWQARIRYTPTIQGNDGAFGRTVAIDGETVGIGAPIYTTPEPYLAPEPDVFFFHAGAVWMYDGFGDPDYHTVEEPSGQYIRSPRLIQQQEFGSAMDIDGDSMVIGAPREWRLYGNFQRDLDIGAVYTFERDASREWVSKQVIKKTGPGSIGDKSGNAVALSGNTMVVGSWETSPFPGASTGAVTTYTRSSRAEGWIQRAVVAPPDAGYASQAQYSPARGDHYGSAVALSGEQLAVGASGDAFDNQTDDPSGSLYIGRVFDDINPSVRIEASGEPVTRTSPVQFDVAFSQKVTGFTSEDVDLSQSTTGGDLEAVVHTSINGRYWVTVTGMTTSGQVIATIPAGAAQGPEGGATQASTSVDNVVDWDSIGPRAIINPAEGQADPTQTVPLRWSVVFAEEPIGISVDDFFLNTGGGSDETLGDLTLSLTGGPLAYEVRADGAGARGDIRLRVTQGGFHDAVGNDGATPTGDQVIRLDASAPGVAVRKAPTQPSPTTGSPLRFEADFTEDVVGFDASDVVFVDDQGGALVAEVSGGPQLYEIQVSGMVVGGSVNVSIPAGAAADGAGNLSRASTSNGGVVWNPPAPPDPAPTVSVIAHPLQASPTDDAPIRFFVTFSEPVTGFTAEDLRFPGSTVGPLTAQISGGTDGIYLVSVFGMPNGTEGVVTLSVKGNSVKDSANNPNSASEEIPSVEWDAKGPTLTIEQAGGQADPTDVGSIHFTATFSEPVTGFDADDIPLAFSTAGGPLVKHVTGGPTVYDIEVTGMSRFGEVIVEHTMAGAAQAIGGGADSDPSTSVDRRVTFSPTAIPTANLLAGPAGVEGADIVLGATAADHESVEWDYVSDTADTGASCAFADPASISTTIRCTDDGRYLLKLTVTGPEPSSIVVMRFATLTVVNAAPTVGALGLPTAPVELGQDVSVGAPVGEAGANDRLTCRVTWGDGAASTGVITDGVCRATRIYTATGLFTVTVAVTDDEGARTEQAASVNVRQRGEQEITFAEILPRRFGDPAFGVAATASSALHVTLIADGGCTVSEANVVTITAASSCTITASQEGNDVWAPAPDVARTFSITRAAQSIQFPNPGPVVYGHEPILLEAATSSGLPVRYQVLSGACVVPAGSSTLTIVGAGTCVVKATSLSNNDYDTVTAQISFVVERHPLTITASNGSMAYGGSGATVVPIHTGFVPGEGPSRLTTRATCSGGSPTLSVGTYAGGTTCSGASSDNYDITYVPGTLIVGATVLTLTASNAEMEYGGPAPTVMATITGFVNDEDESVLTAQPNCFPTGLPRPIGIHPLATTCGGAAAANYVFQTVRGTLTVTGTTLVVRAVDTTKVYGQAVPALTYEITGFVNGDDVSDLQGAPTLSTTATPSSAVGDHPITVEQGTLAAQNYGFEFVDGTLEVTKAPLTIRASDATITYGGPAPSVSPEYVGLVNGDDEEDLTTEPSCTAGSASRPAGSYPEATSCSGAAADDYDIDYATGTLSVDKKVLTVTASDETMTYGDDAPTVSPSYSGFATGDDAADLTTPATCSGGSPTTLAGLHLGGTSCTGGAAANYTFSFVNGKLTVDKATLVATATDAAKDYGAAVPALVYEVTGFVNDEDASVLSGAPALSTTATASSPVGVHPITIGAGTLEAANYAIEYVDGELTVGRVPLVVTASDATMTYGGAAPAVTPGFSGFVNGDDATDLATVPTCVGGSPTTAAGSRPDATSCSGATSPNYTISYGRGTLTVTPAPLSVTAWNAAMTYGEDPPAVAPIYSGFVNGEGPSVLATTPTCAGGSPTTPVGTYAGGTTCSGATAANYSVTHHGGTLTVQPAALTVTGTNATKVYGAAVPTLTYTVTGFVNGETVAVLSGAPSVTTTATASSSVGTYPVTVGAGTLVAPNYVVTYVPADLTVTKAPLAVRADDKAKVHGDAVPALTFTATGFVNGDGPPALSGAPALATAATATSPAGTYAITITPGTLQATNYALTFTNGVLTVTPAVTALRADPAVISLNPLRLTLGRGTARLTVPGSTQSLAGRTVVFTAGTRTLCTATTAANGQASCAFDLEDAVAVVFALGYTATFEGTGSLLPSSSRGVLIS